MAFSNSAKSTHKKRSAICEINITPFVDILLVLLIIFMISAPMMTSSVSINLPKGTKTPIQESNLPISVSVKSDGTIYLQDELIKANELNSSLLKLTSNNLETKIYVQADKALDYGRVMGVVSAISAIGFSKVILVTEIIK